MPQGVCTRERAGESACGAEASGNEGGKKAEVRGRYNKMVVGSWLGGYRSPAALTPCG